MYIIWHTRAFYRTVARVCHIMSSVRPSARPSLTLGMFSHRLEYFENNSTDDYLKVYTRVDPNMDDLV